MTRLCYDSAQASAIPADAAMVAGYCDGAYRWSDADWARFPNAVRVRVAVNPATNDGHVLDVEPGNWDAAASVDWVLMRRAAGLATPTVYCGDGAPGYTRADVLSAHAARGVPPPLLWFASWDGVQAIPAGCIAKQFESDGAYDRSLVADYWPGVDPAPAPALGPDVADAQARLTTLDQMLDEQTAANHAWIQGVREDLNG